MSKSRYLENLSRALKARRVAGIPVRQPVEIGGLWAVWLVVLLTAIWGATGFALLAAALLVVVFGSPMPPVFFATRELVSAHRDLRHQTR